MQTIKLLLQPGSKITLLTNHSDVPSALQLDSEHGLSLQDSLCVSGARLLEGGGLGDKWAQEFLPGD